MATNSKIVIPKEKWDALTQDMKEAAVKLGMSCEKQKMVVREKACEQKQYILLIEETCSLCGEMYRRLFRMTPTLDENQPYLKAQLVPGEYKIDRHEKRILRSCGNCYPNLMTWGKGAIIEKCIELADPKVEQMLKHIEFKARKAAERLALMRERAEEKRRLAEVEAARKKSKKGKKKR